MNYSYAGIGLSADIDGTPLEIVQASLQFPLNDVARGTLKLAIGGNGVGKRAHGYQAVRKARMTRSPVKVVANFTGQEKPGKGWSKSRVTLFDGFITGQRADAVAAETIGLMVNIEHVLAGLDTGNKLSHVIHAESSYDMWKDVAKSAATYRGNDILSPSLTVPNITAIDDIWGQLVKPTFEQLASTGDRIAGTALNRMGGDTVNGQALQAIGVINKNSNMPAAIKRGHELQDVTANSLVNTLAGKESGQSFLDTLLGFCSLWHMAVIPLFESALVVPHTPAYKKIYKKIGADEIFSIAALGDWPRMPIRGVALMNLTSSKYGVGGNTGSVLPPIVGVADLSLMGGRDYSGQMLCLRAPESFGNYIVKTVENRSSKIAANGNNAACIGNPNANMPTPAAKELEGLQDGGFVSDLAKATLCQLRYQGRSIVVCGRVRTDICPGSIVEVEMIGDNDDMVSMFGCVTEVTYTFSAEQPYAATQYTVSFLRTETEQKESPAIMDEHPLFTNTFVGGAMTP